MVSIPPNESYMEYSSWPEARGSPYEPFQTSVQQPSSSMIPTDYSKSFTTSHNLAQSSLRMNYFYPSWGMMSEETPSCMYGSQMYSSQHALLSGQGQYLSSESLYMPTQSLETIPPTYTQDIPSPHQLAYYSVTQTPVLYGSPFGDSYPQYQNPSVWAYDNTAFCTPGSEAVSMPSVASLSPVSDAGWQDSSSQCYQEEEEEEPLQGLGLYDCPELTMDEVDEDFGFLNSKRFSLGRGLKLEESFEYEEVDVDDEESDAEDDE